MKTWFARISIPFLVVAALAGIQLLVQAEFGVRLPATLYLLGVLFAAVASGLGSGILATLVASFMTGVDWERWLAGAPTFGPDDLSDWVRVVLFLIVGCLVSAVASSFRVSWQGFQTSLQELAHLHSRERRARQVAEAEVKQRRLVQGALQQSESKIRRLIDANIIGIIFYHSDGRILEANDAFLSMIGRSRVELLDKGIEWKSITPEDWIEDDRSWWIELRSNGVVAPFEREFLHKRGQRVPVLFGAANFEGSREEGIAYAMDLTELKRAEAAMRESEEKYALATAAARVGTWEWNFERKQFHYLNLQKEIYGLDVESSTLSTATVLTRIHPEDREQARARLEQAVRDRSEYVDEFRILMPDGSVKWLAARGRVQIDSDGLARRMLGTNTEITERKRWETELAQARERAERANKAKSQFLANMSHEIRTPMNAILGFADLLLEPDLSDAEKLNYVSRIRTNGAILLRLIDDILDLTRLESGKIQVIRTKFSPIDIVRDVIQSTKPLAQSKGLAIGISSVTPIPQIIVSDPLRFRQVLMNLIGNAVKFTERGRIDVGLRYSDHFHGKKGSFLVIAVEDTGIGVSSEAVSFLFRPLTQGDETMTRRFGGSGLGLALSRQLSRMMGGGLDLVRSDKENGSTFEFAVETGDVSQVAFVVAGADEPIHAPVEALPKLQKHCPALDGVKVLVAEDSPDNVALMRLYLGKEGAEVAVAHDGVEAIEMAENGNYDIILMDIQMPRLDGLMATQKLREHGVKRPIIAVTAHALQEEVERSKDAGCNDHITKPLDRSKLISSIQRLIELDHSGGLLH